MRKNIAFLCMVAILLSFSACQRNYTHGVYEVSIEAILLSNNSVGNDWQKTYTCNGENITDGEQWIVPLNTTEKITVEVTITEIDAWHDVGHGSIPVILSDGYKASTHITVTENKGRYKGNQAIWKVICEIKITDKLCDG